MANELYTRTNQKLFFASRALEDWRQAMQSTAVNALALQQGACETTLFHLHGALLALCHEVAGYYRLPNARSTHIKSLLAPEVLEATPSPELQLLAELAADAEGWVARLRKAYGVLSEPPQPERKAKVDPATALIVAVAVEEPQESLSPELLAGWLQQLRELAVHCRSGMSEW